MAFFGGNAGAPAFGNMHDIKHEVAARGPLAWYEDAFGPQTADPELAVDMPIDPAFFDLETVPHARRAAGRPRVFTPEEADERLRRKQAYRRHVVRVEARALLRYVSREFFEQWLEGTPAGRAALSMTRQNQLVLAYMHELVSLGKIPDIAYEMSAQFQLGVDASAHGDENAIWNNDNYSVNTGDGTASEYSELSDGTVWGADDASVAHGWDMTAPCAEPNEPAARADSSAILAQRALRAEHERQNRDSIRASGANLLRYIPNAFMQDWLSQAKRRGSGAVDSRTPFITYAERPRLVRAYFDHLYDSGVLTRIELADSAVALCPDPYVNDAISPEAVGPPLPNDSRITVTQRRREMLGELDAANSEEYPVPDVATPRPLALLVKVSNVERTRAPSDGSPSDGFPRPLPVLNSTAAFPKPLPVLSSTATASSLPSAATGRLPPTLRLLAESRTSVPRAVVPYARPGLQVVSQSTGPFASRANSNVALFAGNATPLIHAAAGSASAVSTPYRASDNTWTPVHSDWNDYMTPDVPTHDTYV